MTDERFTMDEVRAAWNRARKNDKTPPSYLDLADLVAELTRPAIGPNVPVMYWPCSDDDDYLAFFENLGARGERNLRVLIPVPDAREIARRAIAQYSRGVTTLSGAIAEVDRDLAAYTRGEPS